MNVDHEKSKEVMGNVPNEAPTKLIEGSNEPGATVPIPNNGDVKVLPVVDNMDCITEVTSTSEYSIGGDNKVTSELATSVQSGTWTI